MSMLTRLANRVWPRRLARDLEDEVGFHIDMRASEHVKSGMSADDATKEAHQQFGDVETVVASMRKERLASTPMLFATTAVLIAVVLLWIAQQQPGGGDSELPQVRAVSIFKDPNLPPTGSPPPPPPPPPRRELGPPWFTFNQQTKAYEPIEKGPGVYSPGRLLDDEGRLINDAAKAR
jgi:hypothetical protein